MFRVLKSLSSHNALCQYNVRTPLCRSSSNLFHRNEVGSAKIKTLQKYRIDQKKWDQWKQDGTIELAFGYTMLACIGIDYLFDKLKSKERQRLMDHLRLVVHNDELKRMATVVSDAASTSMISGNVVQADAGDVINYQDNNHPFSYGAFGDIDEIINKESDKKKVLFRCRVRRVPRSFDGTRSLRFVKEGDVVEVLEENTGPGGGYNHCRRQRLADEENEKINIKRRKILDANDVSIDENNVTWLKAPKYDEGSFPTTLLEKI